jgi:hypothetical protein
VSFDVCYNIMQYYIMENLGSYLMLVIWRCYYFLLTFDKSCLLMKTRIISHCCGWRCYYFLLTFDKSCLLMKTRIISHCCGLF